MTQRLIWDSFPNHSSFQTRNLPAIREKWKFILHAVLPQLCQFSNLTRLLSSKSLQENHSLSTSQEENQGYTKKQKNKKLIEEQILKLDLLKKPDLPFVKKNEKNLFWQSSVHLAITTKIHITAIQPAMHLKMFWMIQSASTIFW